MNHYPGPGCLSARRFLVAFTNTLGFEKVASRLVAHKRRPATRADEHVDHPLSIGSLRGICVAARLQDFVIVSTARITAANVGLRTDMLEVLTERSPLHRDPQLDPVIRGVHQILLRSEVTLGRLY